MKTNKTIMSDKFIIQKQNVFALVRYVASLADSYTVNINTVSEKSADI
jgi:hypothetical protein